VALPVLNFDCGGKQIEAFTLEDKASKSYEILFIDKETQKSLGSYSVQNPKFAEKGNTYDVTSYFDFVVSDFKKING